MPKDLRIKLDGKPYRMRYTLRERYDIERVANASAPNAGNLTDILTSGKMLEQAIVIWAGIKGADPDVKMTPRGVIEACDRHNQHGDYYQEVYCPAAVLAVESGLIGKKVDLDEFRRLIGYEEPKGKEEAEGGEEPPPEAVRAAE